MEPTQAITKGATMVGRHDAKDRSNSKTQVEILVSISSRWPVYAIELSSFI